MSKVRIFLFNVGRYSMGNPRYLYYLLVLRFTCITYLYYLLPYRYLYYLPFTCITYLYYLLYYLYYLLPYRYLYYLCYCSEQPLPQRGFWLVPPLRLLPGWFHVQQLWPGNWPVQVQAGRDRQALRPVRQPLRPDRPQIGVPE